jgi:hypothetical protein
MGNKFESSGDLTKETNPKTKKKMSTRNMKDSPPVKCLLAGTGTTKKIKNNNSKGFPENLLYTFNYYA